jgi:carbamoyltransferase
VLVLGIIDSKPSTAALLDGDRIIAAIAEERLCRKKLATGVPRLAIDRVIEMSGARPAEIERVAIAQKISVFEPEPRAWSSWFDGEISLKQSSFDRLGSSLAPILGRFPVVWRTHHRIKGWIFRERLSKLPQLLRDEHGIAAPVRFYDHHYCHATAAYYTSGFDEALVVTLDGGGDGLSGSVHLGRRGRLQKLGEVDSFNSLGNFYSYITVLCGFKAERHEGKITGLAAYGEPHYADLLREFIGYRVPGRISYLVPMYHRSALRLLRERLPEDFDRADLAASVQLVLEEVATAFIRHWLKRTGMRRLALAGGVFANVKLNQRLHELQEVESIFVHPAMDDGGLSVGSALAAMAEEGPGSTGSMMGRLPDVYLGPSYESGEVARAIETNGFEARRDERIHETIADKLAQGYVVARFTGRMEYGPRALGGRSILYRADDPSVNDWLNARLRRTEFMPFAPATLAEHAHRCFENLEGAEDPARFMTITFDCTEEMKRRSPGVVHLDDTARPQLVDRETSPDLHAILTAYHRRTANPSIINTSFNIHEEPIVCTPEEALRVFELGHIDYLAIHDFLIRHPESDHRSQKCKDSSIARDAGTGCGGRVADQP